MPERERAAKHSRSGAQRHAAPLRLDRESFLSMMRASFREKTLFFCRRRHL